MIGSRRLARKKLVFRTISVCTILCGFVTPSIHANDLKISGDSGKITADYRNLALNPDDSTDQVPSSFPHATSNSEYNHREFAARCAIDGKHHDPSDHRSGSWGPKKESGIWWRLDFGRLVEIDKLLLYLRADWSNASSPHDSYWKTGKAEFSDGSSLKLSLRQTAEGQIFTFPKKKVSWLVLKDLEPAADRWCALCQLEAWGVDACTSPFSYVGDDTLARSLHDDSLVNRAITAMMGFQRASWEQGVAGQALMEAGEQEATMALARASLVHININGIAASFNPDYAIGYL